MTDQNQSSDQTHTHITCSHCDYDLTGIDLQGLCPECGESIITNCFQCDYDLAGLDHSGVCPECGFSIEGSIGRGELAKADPQYLAALHKGVFIIQAVIIVTVITVLIGMFGGIAAALMGGINIGISQRAVDIIATIISLAFAIATFFGWWLFSTEDPAYSGSYDGSSARKLIRIMVVLGIVTTAINLVLDFFPDGDVLAFVIIGIALIGVVVSVVRFFAAMVYIKWMAPLMRNKKVYNRAKLLMWLGPVLMTVGILLLGLGPLIALVLYWNMLDWIRKDLKSIRQHIGAIA